ncbi:MAG: efflux RND transporter periplasmic adaptor subunit [Gammaproteobacteria bacterium]|nr:efflux RND transporter periplasmic adaptor subunit [Gammaproteobacteria bacterium]
MALTQKKVTRMSAHLMLLGAMLFGHPVIAEPIPVVSESFSTLAIYPSRSAPATVVSDNDSRISAEVSARILDIPVRVGDRVKQGTLLLRLEQKDFELALTREKAALTALKAKLDLAEYELKRARSLSKKQAVSEQLLKQRETERDSLLAEQQGQQAAKAQAQRQIDKTQIRAPFNAVIAERLAQTGELANPGTALLRITDIDNLELAARLSAQQTRDLRHLFATENTRTVEFASSGQRYALTLRTITPIIDTRARTREARLRFTGTPPLPGATGQLTWSPQQASLPADLISQRDGKLGVFIQADNKARFITLPQAITGQPVIISKLEPDTLIITKGRYRLRDGDAISRTNTDVAAP